MAEIHNLKELERRGELESGDKVFFHINEEILEYVVSDFFYLRNCEESIIGVNNHIIFLKLGFDEEDVRKLIKDVYSKCKKYFEAYTIEAILDEYRFPYWPLSELNEYSVLSSIVLEIYKIIEKKNEPIVPIKKFTRFEIMDI